MKGRPESGRRDLAFERLEIEADESAQHVPENVTSEAPRSGLRSDNSSQSVEAIGQREHDRAASLVHRPRAQLRRETDARKVHGADSRMRANAAPLTPSRRAAT